MLNQAKFSQRHFFIERDHTLKSKRLHIKDHNKYKHGQDPIDEENLFYLSYILKSRKYYKLKMIINTDMAKIQLNEAKEERDGSVGSTITASSVLGCVQTADSRSVSTTRVNK